MPWQRCWLLEWNNVLSHHNMNIVDCIFPSNVHGRAHVRYYCHCLWVCIGLARCFGHISHYYIKLPILISVGLFVYKPQVYTVRVLILPGHHTVYHSESTIRQYRFVIQLYVIMKYKDICEMELNRKQHKATNFKVCASEPRFKPVSSSKRHKYTAECVRVQ